MKPVDEVHERIWDMCKFNAKEKVKRNDIFSDDEKYIVADLALPSFIVHCFETQKCSGYVIEDIKDKQIIYFNKTDKEEYLIDQNSKKFDLFLQELTETIKLVKREIKKVRNHENALCELAISITEKLKS